MDRKKIRQNIWNSRVLWAVFSIIASILLWVYVTTTEGDLIEVTYDGVQVVFKGEETLRDNEGLVLSNINTNTVSVRIRATRREIAKLSSSNIFAVVDVAKFDSIGYYTQNIKFEFPLGSDRNSISVIGTSPQNISFKIEKTSNKIIQIDGRFEGTVKEGFAVQPIQFNPQTVKISGPESEIEKVAYGWVEVYRENVDKTIQFKSSYVLVDQEGNELNLRNITLETETVSVTIPVTLTKEVPLTVNIVEGGGATAENVKITCEPSTITVAGDADTLAGINQISLGTVDLSSFTVSTEENFKIVLDNNVTNVNGIQQAKVTVKVVGLDTKTFNVTNITTINVPSGKTASVITENIEVILRGNSSVLAKIKENNLRAVVDLAELGNTTGVIEPLAKIQVDGFTGVGAIGQYPVYVSIK